jgi:hypothetical protein
VKSIEKELTTLLRRKRKYETLGWDLFYNSSKNIEGKYLNQLKNIGFEYKVETGDGHKRVLLVPFEYEKRLSTEEGRIEWGQYFWNILEEQIGPTEGLRQLKGPMIKEMGSIEWETVPNSLMIS